MQEPLVGPAHSLCPRCQSCCFDMPQVIWGDGVNLPWLQHLLFKPYPSQHQVQEQPATATPLFKCQRIGRCELLDRTVTKQQSAHCLQAGDVSTPVQSAAVHNRCSPRPRCILQLKACMATEHSTDASTSASSGKLPAQNRGWIMRITPHPRAVDRRRAAQPSQHTSHMVPCSIRERRRATRRADPSLKC